MQYCVILRSLPGGGKTSLIQHIEEQYNLPAFVCSADHFHYYDKPHLPENYKYDIKRASLAHETCKTKFIEGLKYNESLIIVDNTNINTKDYMWYYKKAREYNYNIVFYSIRNCTVEQSFKNNQHMVPLFVIENMLKNYKIIPDRIFLSENDEDGELVDEIIYDFNELMQGKYNNIKHLYNSNIYDIVNNDFSEKLKV